VKQSPNPGTITVHELTDMNIQAPRGTRDILPDQQPGWRHVAETVRAVSQQLSFRPITVPTYEELALFTRSIGGGTDIMDKELFLARGIRSEEESQYALRPEGTAGIVRAFVQHGMHTWPQPVRLFSIVNNFRYDRPQKGRYREHVQVSLEYFGDFGPFADAWVIFTTWTILSRLGLKSLMLQLNTLGTKEERLAYEDALRQHLEPLRDQLSEDSRSRLESNPLRILDSKDASDRRLVADAPKLSGSLGEASQAHFESVRRYLDSWQIPYELNPSLVRGLDYYCHTAFEWTVADAGGQQASLGGGGRYDGLLPQLDGPNIGAVGAGLGLDRVIEECERQGTLPTEQAKPDLYLVAADEAGREVAVRLIAELTKAGLSVDANLSKEGFGPQIKAAGRSGARFAAIIGADEAGAGEVTLKNLENGEQERLAQHALYERVPKG